jgi:hypothetical protein
MERLSTDAPHMQRLKGDSAMTEHVVGDDYNLRVLIERMQRMGSSEREITMAVREASGCLARPAGPRWGARPRPSFWAIGRRLQNRDRLWKREEAQQ